MTKITFVLEVSLYFGNYVEALKIYRDYLIS